MTDLERPGAPITPTALLAIVIADAIARGRTDETTLSFGWWEGDRFNARVKATLGEARRYLEAGASDDEVTALRRHSADLAQMLSEARQALGTIATWTADPANSAFDLLAVERYAAEALGLMRPSHAESVAALEAFRQEAPAAFANIVPPDTGCPHSEIVPRADGLFGRCSACGDDTFQIASDQALRLLPMIDRFVSETRAGQGIRAAETLAEVLKELVKAQ